MDAEAGGKRTFFNIGYFEKGSRLFGLPFPSHPPSPVMDEFQNNPEVVALANRNVIKDYLHAFRNIEFAVAILEGSGAL